MPSARITLAALALLAAATRASADAVALTPATSIYEDDKNRPLREPEGVACTDGGRFVVADTGNGRLLEFAYTNRTVSGGAETRLPQLPYPTRVQIDSKGNLLVLDRKLRRIGRVDAKGAFGGYVEFRSASSSDGVVPGAFKLDGSDNLYVLDLAKLEVLVADSSGNVTRRLALPRDGAAFTDVAVDPAGTVYVVDAARGTLWSAAKSDTAFTVLAKGLKEYASFPDYLVARRGRLFVVDQNGHGLVVLGNDGSYQGRQLSIGWNDGLLYYPGQLCVSEQGEAYVADRQNNRVQIFRTSR